jgi:hypothetical protein
MEEFRKRPSGVEAGVELKALIAEASRALARLDSARLEEIALSCRALNQGLESLDGRGRKDLARQARVAAADMAVFARVLDATRGNLRVMNRLRELRMGRLEYSERQARGGVGAGSPSTGLRRWGEGAEAGHGDH